MGLWRAVYIFNTIMIEDRVPFLEARGVESSRE